MPLLIPFHVIMFHMVQWTLKEYVKNHKTFWFQLTPFPLFLSLDKTLAFRNGVGVVGKEIFMLKALAHLYIIMLTEFLIGHAL